MKINEILQKQEWDMSVRNPGALKDKKDHRDYKVEELLVGVEIKRPSFQEGYSVIKKVYPNMKRKDQGRTFSCVGQAWTLYKQILQKLDTGEETELSAFSVYNPIAIPGTGSYIRDGGMRTVNYGLNKEATLPSPKEEDQMTRKFDFKPYEEEAAFYKNRIVAKTDTQDIEKLADLIFLNNGIVSGFGSHAIYFDEYGILNGKRFIKSINSYGDDTDIYWFEGKVQGSLFSIWTAIDLKIILNSPESLYADLKYEDKGNEVLKLKQALKRLGWIAARTGEKLTDNDIYDSNLAAIVRDYKKANLYGDSVWGRFWEEFLFKGKSVDLKTRENINFNLTKK